MSEFTKASHERINAFQIGDQFWFKHYFNETRLFHEIGSYYNGSDYRFEVPPDDFETVAHLLANHGYGLVKVPELPPFVVAKPKYTDFPDILFKSKVTKTSSADYVFFLMKDREVVNRAVREGATLATELDEEIPSFRNN